MKVKVTREWFDKDVFSCIECEAGNESINWDEDNKVLFCKKCKHELTEKKELQNLYGIVGIQCYGFWLRFCHEHFVPCEACQEKLDEIIMGKQKKDHFGWSTRWVFNSDIPVKLSVTEKEVCFGFNFVWQQFEKAVENIDKGVYQDHTIGSLSLCKSCVKKFRRKVINANELHFGNEALPPVELWRKWMHDEKRTAMLEDAEKVARGMGIHVNSFYANAMNKKTTKQLDVFLNKWVNAGRQS